MSHELSHLAQKQGVSLFHTVWTAQKKVGKGYNYYHKWSLQQKTFAILWSEMQVTMIIQSAP